MKKDHILKYFETNSIREEIRIAEWGWREEVVAKSYLYFYVMKTAKTTKSKQYLHATGRAVEDKACEADEVKGVPALAISE